LVLWTEWLISDRSALNIGPNPMPEQCGKSGPDLFLWECGPTPINVLSGSLDLNVQELMLLVGISETADLLRGI
jgi:hypothetical protein